MPMPTSTEDQLRRDAAAIAEIAGRERGGRRISEIKDELGTEMIPVFPTAHYAMGGVPTNIKGEALADNHPVIPGLYAAGEVACVSVHGGNRLGANSLLDTLIFGRRSGEHAAKRALAMGMPKPTTAALRDEERVIDDILRRSDTGGRRVSEIKDELGTVMNEKCAVFRDEAGLTEAYEVVKRLKEQAGSASIDDRGTVFNQDVLGAIELGYMLDCAECVVIGALERRESRGAQFRLDFPKRNDDQWLKHITLSVNGGGPPQVSYTPVTLTKWEPQERTY
jgi:succinate dehydrogenase / fumarate reductase flavoprotein subunit